MRRVVFSALVLGWIGLVSSTVGAQNPGGNAEAKKLKNPVASNATSIAAGKAARVATEMGTTNGIEVSPDGKTLYVNESVQRNVWAFDLAPDGELVNKRLIRQFPDHGFDGMRCDVDGNLYITRHGKGTVVKMTPAGVILREIAVLGANPTNICFGGPDGCTAHEVLLPGDSDEVVSSSIELVLRHALAKVAAGVADRT